mgnify:CR=1 FL=1
MPYHHSKYSKQQTVEKEIISNTYLIRTGALVHDLARCLILLRNDGVTGGQRGKEVDHAPTIRVVLLLHVHLEQRVIEGAGGS